MLHERPGFGHAHEVCHESGRELQGFKVICYHCGKAFAKEETNYQARAPARPAPAPPARGAARQHGHVRPFWAVEKVEWQRVRQQKQAAPRRRAPRRGRRRSGAAVPVSSSAR